MIGMLRVCCAMAGLALVCGCQTTQAPAPPTKPQNIGPVSSQPGSCFFKDPTGKVYVAPCG
jgi:hypothetical protein